MQVGGALAVVIGGVLGGVVNFKLFGVVEGGEARALLVVEGGDGRQLADVVQHGADVMVQ